MYQWNHLKQAIDLSICFPTQSLMVIISSFLAAVVCVIMLYCQEDDNMQIFCKKANAFFKRTVLALRLSLKSLDSIIEEMEDYEYKDTAL
jgi:hypothetical protein